MEPEVIVGTLMAAVAVVELGVGIWQARLTKKLKNSNATEWSKVKQDLQKRVTKEELQKGLNERATKQEVRELERGIEQTVQRSVPGVLREMAEQYESHLPADQGRNSDADSG